MKYVSVITKEMLDQNQYMVSLINAGARKGLLDSNLLNSTPIELMEIFKEVMRMYTKGESSTLKAETAEGLMKSIVFSLDLFLMKFPNPEDAITHLKSCSINTIYKEALDYIKDYFEKTRQLYKTIEGKRLSIPNAVYTESFTEAIPNFFAKYNVIFSAQETSCDIDYPLTSDISSASGIAYIRKYLEVFELENEFCLKFDYQNIITLLQTYGKSNGLNYKQSPINIFELVFQNAVFSTMLEKNYQNLLLSDIEFEIIEEKLNGLNKDKIKDLIVSTLDTIINNLEITNFDLIDLIHHYAGSMISRLYNALEHGNLANMLVLEAAVKTKDSSTLELGRKMNNKTFRFIYRRIVSCTTPEDKLALLTKYISSFDDFLDLLRADCFYEKEYDYVFESLRNIELSTLICKEFKEHMLRGTNNLSILFTDNVSYKYDWEKAFVHWLRKLDEDRIKEIELLAHKNLAAEII
jgi:hypothetical protein